MAEDEMQDEMQQLTLKQGIGEVSLLHYPIRNVKKYHELHTDKARKSRCASSDIFSPAALYPTQRRSKDEPGGRGEECAIRSTAYFENNLLRRGEEQIK